MQESFTCQDCLISFSIKWYPLTLDDEMPETDMAPELCPFCAKGLYDDEEETDDD